MIINNREDLKLLLLAKPPFVMMSSLNFTFLSCYSTSQLNISTLMKVHRLGFLGRRDDSILL